MKNGVPRSLNLEPESIRNYFSKNFWQKMILDINKCKGKSHEKEFAQLYIDSLNKKIDTSNLTIVIDKECFYCFDENTKKRRFDIFIKELLIGFEIKSYRVVNNKFIRMQIEKDKWLLENRKINEIRWILYNGATSNVLQSLTQNKILYLDITGDENNFTNIKQIYHEENGIVLTQKGITVIPL